MLVDSREWTGDPVLNCDICIVGGGAAGITLAREFIGTRQSVILLESGGLDFEAPTQSLYQGESTGNVFANAQQYLTSSRLRYFGGSTNHWAGYCRPLEALDFEERPWVPDSGWGLRPEDFRDYYRRAMPILNLPGFDYDTNPAFHPSRSPLSLNDDSAIRTSMIHFSSPTRFGMAYREELAKAPNIRVLLHGNAVDLLTDPDGQRVTRLRARCLSKTEFSIDAKRFILATGGIENARMLLLSRTQQPRGLGNQNDLVGRYFMEHLAMTGGEIIVTIPSQHLTLYERILDPLRKHDSLGLFATTPAAQRDRSLLAFTARVLSIKPRAVRRERRELGQAIAQFDRLNEMNGPGAQTGIVYSPLRIVSEQAPNAASRITLSEKRDLLGLNRVRLDWRVQPNDYESIHRSLRLLGQELGRASRGRVRLGVRFADGELAPRTNGGNHHMGTTRMHADPRRGVVDLDCRVHGIPNLFVAGSSVFPTGGAEGTTTLTLLALTLRLSDLIKRELSA